VSRTPVEVVAAVSLGGALGAVARYGLTVAVPTPPDQWPWATFVTNVTGCLAIGALMVIVVELTAPHRLVRPFLGPGLLGGFTTFSTYALETRTLVAHGHLGLAAGYVVASLALGLLAVWLGAQAARAFAVAGAGLPGRHPADAGTSVEEVADEAHGYGVAADGLPR
jgi:fluoride exporter